MRLESLAIRPCSVAPVPSTDYGITGVWGETAATAYGGIAMSKTIYPNLAGQRHLAIAPANTSLRGLGLPSTTRSGGRAVVGLNPGMNRRSPRWR
jgi:hypothetical protein